MSTTVGPFTVAHDPAAGGCWFDVDPVGGDVPCPTVLSLADDGTGVHRVFATRRRGDPSGIPWVVQAGDVEVVDSRSVKADGASGGRALRSKAAPDREGARCLATTCPPPVAVGRGKAVPSEASHDAAGTYTCFARIRKTDPEAQAEVWLTYGHRDLRGAHRRRTRIETGPATDWWYYDLGTVQVNGGGGPLLHDDRTTGARPVAPLPIAVHVRDLDEQPGGIEIDHLVFLPADTETCAVHTHPTGVPATVVVDGENRSTYRINRAGALLPSGAWHSGGIPHLGSKSPTRVFVLSGVHDGTKDRGAPSVLDGTTVVSVAYRTRHLRVPQLRTGAPEPNLP